MQTVFTHEQLRNPDVAESEKILRRCVHCGFCTATCPTYVLLGDELDSPRGRIYLIKDMLENDRPASAQVVKHIDRCLSCLACMTTCPSDVHYMHLVDHARRHIEETYRRPLADRLLRAVLATVLPRPTLFRLALLGAKVLSPFARLLPARGEAGRLRAMLQLAPRRLPSPSPVDAPQVFPAEGARRARVALLSGCAQQALAPEINEATIRLLTRHGAEVVVAKEAGCCGSLTHHMGKERQALRSARRNIDAWCRELAGPGLDAVVVNASGCGTTVKDYGFMLREDGTYADKAARISTLAKDVTELMIGLGLKPAVVDTDLVVAYQSACSMQHGQGVTAEPKALLAQAGFTVRDVPEGHLCCGSAGTYNLLQPEIAARLRERKVANIEHVRPDVIASGNIGCIAQIAAGTSVPIVHTVALLDWATGGPPPQAIAMVALDRGGDKRH
jgi:glycolate oxidase iron-sulfur subunit